MQRKKDKGERIKDVWRLKNKGTKLEGKGLRLNNIF
jgi:hypothetical protein